MYPKGEGNTEEVLEQGMQNIFLRACTIISHCKAKQWGLNFSGLLVSKLYGCHIIFSANVVTVYRACLPFSLSDWVGRLT